MQLGFLKYIYNDVGGLYILFFWYVFEVFVVLNFSREEIFLQYIIGVLFEKKLFQYYEDVNDEI